MRQIITDDFGEVKLNGIALPGIFDSLEISGEIDIDEIDVPGTSGKKKQPQGFQDASLVFRIEVLTDDESNCYDKAKQIVQTFKKTDSTAKPLVHRIVNKHAAIWDIEEVIIKNVKTRESNKDDAMIVEINMIEYEPALVQKEKAVQPAPQQTEETTTEAEPRRGSPAIDDDIVMMLY